MARTDTGRGEPGRLWTGLPGGVVLFAAALLAAWPVQAQHDTPHEPAPEHAHHDPSHAAHPGGEGSGTSRLPEATPLYGLHARTGAWNLMVHGSAFLRYTAQDALGRGDRGADEFGSTNWIMGMGRRRFVGGHTLGLRAMLTLEPLTEGDSGYPLLFQTGETYDGLPLIDRQHPHDLFAEVAVSYEYALDDSTHFFAYAAWPGEPALGPTAFMHRPSARHLPAPPLAHHWQDATHVTFGVATLGLQIHAFRVEGSLFTGREPDEDRYGFDRPRFDAYSMRASATLGRRWAVQASRAFIHSPDVLVPAADQWRTTASVTYHRPLGARGYWTTTAVWGMNEPAGRASNLFNTPPASFGALKTGRVRRTVDVQDAPVMSRLHAVLMESDLQWGAQAVFFRGEWVEKAPEGLGVIVPGKDDVGIGALTVGTARDVLEPSVLMIGLQTTLYYVPAALRPVYGTQPMSLDAFLRIGFPRLPG